MLPLSATLPALSLLMWQFVPGLASTALRLSHQVSQGKQRAACCWPQVLVPPLRELESYIFESIFRHLWARCLIDSITNDPQIVSHGTGTQMTAMHKAAAHEDAIRRWLDALQVGACCMTEQDCRNIAPLTCLTSLSMCPFYLHLFRCPDAGGNPQACLACSWALISSVMHACELPQSAAADQIPLRLCRSWCTARWSPPARPPPPAT